MADRTARPLILIRGFGGPDVTDEQRSPYQGFNDGTAYPGKRGENYLYEGFILRALKSERYPYNDATNVIGYYDTGPVTAGDAGADPGTIVIDPAVEQRVLRAGVAGTIWVYRYYDLSPRALSRYGEGLTTLIELIKQAAERHEEQFDGVDVMAHSMGGLVVREALRQFHETEPGSAQRFIHRIVTLGTPHRGIAFQRIPRWMLERLPLVEKSQDEFSAFDPSSVAFRQVGTWFPIERILTVVGTNYRSYGTSAASALNRLSSLLDDGTLVTNRSDGLVKQSAAQLPGAPRTFIHKCHGGTDSLVTSREAYEIAMRFFHGSHRVRLWLDKAEILRGKDWFGRSEFYFGVSIKPRHLDFDLFHQSAEAENCYGPFRDQHLRDDLPDLRTELAKPLAESGDNTTGWAGSDRLIWEGWLDVGAKPDGADTSMVFRLDLYVGERDTIGIGFSDDVIFRKQYFVQAVPGDELEIFIHTGQEHLGPAQPKSLEQLKELAGDGAAAAVQRARREDHGQWTFDVAGTGFTGRLRVAIEEAA